MISYIINFSIQNKLITGLFTVLLIAWGIYAARQINIDAVPDISNNQVQVITTSEHLTALEVEKFITYQVELAIGNLPGVIEIRSISRFGLSVVTIVFEEDMGTYLPRQLVSEKLKEAEGNIGTELGRPYIGPITTGLGEIYQYTLEALPAYADEYDVMQLRSINDWLVKRQLTMIPGVVEVGSWGGYLKQYEVAINPALLNSYGISLLEVFEVLKNNNENTGASYIEKGSELYYIRGEGLVETLEDIRQTVIKTREGIPIRIGNVAEVGFGHAPRYGAATANGAGEAVVGIVMMLKHANSADAIKHIKQRIAAIEKTLPEGVTIRPFLDRTKLIKKTTRTVSENLLLGGLIVIGALVFFLGVWRAGLIVASVIPLSICFVFGMMHVFGISANLMSLGALDFGIIVDGSVIIVEAITVYLVRDRLKIGQFSIKQKKEYLDKAASRTSSKMMRTAFFGQIIILIVFIPILSLSGIEGKMFRPMAITFSFAIIGATLLCLTYVPMMSALMLREAGQPKGWGVRCMHWMERVYQPIIVRVLKIKGFVLGVAILMIAGSVVIFSQLGGEFIPKLDEGDLALEAEMPAGTNLKEMVQQVSRMEQILLDSFPEVKAVVSKIGSGEVPTDPMPIDRADVMVILAPPEQWTTKRSKAELLDAMQDKLQTLPLAIEFSQPIEMRFNELMTGVKQDVAIKIYGENLDILQEKANEVVALVQRIPGAVDVQAERVVGLPQIVIQYKRNKLAAYGLHVKELNNLVRAAFAGSVAGKVYEEEKSFELVVRLSPSFRKNLRQIQQLYIPLPTGTTVPLSDVANIDWVDAPAQISRDNTRRRIFVGVNIRNRDTESVLQEIQKSLESNLQLPAGYVLSYGGEFENLLQAKQRLSVIVPIVLVLIFIILFISLRTFKQALLIYTAIPFAMVGGVLALRISDMPFSISAAVGFIALFGVAVLNGLVLISKLNELKAQGISDVKQRVYQATLSRLRPIFLTAITDILGFLPMALSTSAGAEVQRPLAVVVIGGVLSASVLTLIVLPVLYVYAEQPVRIRKPALGIIGMVGVIGLFFLVTPSIHAQQNPNTVALDQAITYALEHNGTLQASRHTIQSHTMRQNSAFNLDDPIIKLQYGQYNGFQNDVFLSITQKIALPTVYIRQAKALRAATQQAVVEEKQAQNILITAIKSYWYEIIYLQKQRELLLQIDTLFEKMQAAAILHFEVGNSNQLAKITAQTQYVTIQNKLQKNAADQIIAETKLQALLNAPEPLGLNFQEALNRPLPAAQDLSANPTLQQLQAQVNKQKQQIKLEQNTLLPNLGIGYQNQSLQGSQFVNGVRRLVDRNDRFHSFVLNLNIPLWYWQHSARIRANKQQLQAESNKYTQLQRHLQGKLTALLQEHDKQVSTLQYYTNHLLVQADIMLENAWLGYTEGAIDYIIVAHSVQQATQIKQNYLDELYQSSQLVIAIEHLLANY